MTQPSPSLVQLAAERGLGTTASLLARFPAAAAFNRLSSNDPRLLAHPNTDGTDVLGQMVRRGLDPALVRAALAWFSGRPLELGLFAWDVLAGALLPTDALLVAELRRAARPLREVLPEPGQAGIDLNRHPAEKLVARYSGMRSLSQSGTVELLAGTADYKLASLAELARRGDDLVRRPAFLLSVQAFARILHLAHLPTLASVYFDYLSRALGHRPAALDLCETLFDADAAQRIPADAIRPGDLPASDERDTAEYLTYRSWLAMGDPVQAHALVETNLANRPETLPPPTAKLLVVRAHLGTLFEQKPVPLSSLEQICDQQRLWRYAAAVRVTVAAAQLPAAAPDPLTLLHDFITAFGNDTRCWRDTLTAAPANAAWKKDSLALLGREATHLPHERSIWQAINLFVVGEKLIRRAQEEIDTRLREQCRLDNPS